MNDIYPHRPGPSRSLLPRVVVAICTYKRPQQLKSCLTLVAEQLAEASGEFQTRILVVDNDHERSAEPMLQNARRDSTSRVGVDYLVEPRAGVGYARNAAFGAVCAGEWLIFFDDDQVPESGWFRAFSEKVACGEDGMWTGVVLPEEDTQWPIWGAGGWAWGGGRDDFEDGTSRSVCGFGSVLMSPGVLEDPDCIVPTVYLSGPGEDTVVSTMMTSNGWQLMHLSQARARETIPLDRLNKSWVYKRHFNNGVTLSKLHIYMGGRLKTVRNLLSAVNVSLKAFSGLLVYFLSLRKQPRMIVESTAEFHRAGGIVVGCFKSTSVKRRGIKK